MTRRPLLVEADGGSRGNPGPAGYGAVVRDATTGEVLAERSGAIGRATNNVAEYEGLLAGLRAAGEFGGGPVEVRLDSKLLVEQMSGRWRVKHADLKPLASEAARLVRGLGPVTFTWVPRLSNADADRLANEAMDAAAGIRRSAAPLTPTAANSVVGWLQDRPAPTRTLLLRHGETPLSVEKRFSGRGDAALTAAGHAQAAALAARLAEMGRVDAIVSSPLHRARQTAQAVADALNLPVSEDDGLAETDFGAWEGSTMADVRARWPAELDAWLTAADVAPPGGESFTATELRVRRARDRILRDHGGTTVAMISHVTPIKILLRLALNAPPRSLFRMHLDLTGVSEVDWYTDGPALVRRMNDTSHLGPR